MYERPRFCGVIYTDTLNGKVTSLDGNKYAQVFATSDFFAKVYPMDTNAKAGDALKEFITDFGVPDKVVMDGASEQMEQKTNVHATTKEAPHRLPYYRTRTLQPVQSRRGDKGNMDEIVPGNDQVSGAETTLGLWTPVGC